MTSVRQLRDALLAWLAAQAATVPVAIYRYLLPHERGYVTVRQHPAILLGPLALAFGGLIAASLISVSVTSGTVVVVIWLIWTALLIYVAFRAVDWLESFFVVTDLRIILATGFFRRRIDFIPLDLLNEIEFKRSVTGRILGYASFTLASRAPSQVIQKIDFVPNPEDLYKKVMDAVFLPRKVQCPECHGEGAVWMPSGPERPPVLRDENSEVDPAPGSGRGYRELLEAGFEQVECSVCNGDGVVSRDLDA